MNRKKLTNIDTTGFNVRSSQSGRRFYKKDGTPNVVKTGLGIFDRLSLFHSMLSMPQWKFWTLMCSGFVVINLIFASIYYSIGIENLGGVQRSSDMHNFLEAFFFSAQTFTTVGYGKISPSSMMASSVAAFEAFLGLLGFAFATGLLYGRFSRPRAFLKFSENALISPYKDGVALMFRTAPHKNTHLMELECRVTAGMRLDEEGTERNYFYNMPLEFSKINTLTMSWTIVHPINQDSPIYNMTMEDMKKSNLEILIYIKAFDEGFSNTVIARMSYTADEIIEGGKFAPMFHPSSSGDATILELDKLSDYERVKLPELIRVEPEQLVTETSSN